MSIHNKLRHALSEQERASQGRRESKCEWDLAVIKYSHALAALNEYTKVTA